MMTAIMDGRIMVLEYEQVTLTSKGKSILESELMIFSACVFSC